MSLQSYLFEKACYVPESLARFAGDLQLLPAESPASRELRAYLDVALRHGLIVCSAIAHTAFDGDWGVRLSREGASAWKNEVKPILEAAFFGPDERDERVRAAGLPRTREFDQETPEIDPAELLSKAACCIAALLDLTEIARKHRAHEIEEARFCSHLTQAFGGATKVLATLIDAEWDTDWPRLLAEKGRRGLEGFIEDLTEDGDAWRLPLEDLAPREEAWLREIDPERTAEAELEAERQRRARVTEKNRTLYDLVLPKAHRHVTLDGLLVDKVPGHDVCFNYAKSPEGTLIIHGELASGIYEIQWAIARYWFVDELQSVGAVKWDDLVADNLMAQNPGLWDSPRLILHGLRPVKLSDGTVADPGYAERMLEYRIERGFPTVATIERYSFEDLNFRPRTIELLKQSKNVVLSRLSKDDRDAEGMFR